MAWIWNTLHILCNITIACYFISVNFGSRRWRWAEWRKFSNWSFKTGGGAGRTGWFLNLPKQSLKSTTVSILQKQWKAVPFWCFISNAMVQAIVVLRLFSLAFFALTNLFCWTLFFLFLKFEYVCCFNFSTMLTLSFSSFFSFFSIVQFLLCLICCIFCPAFGCGTLV